MESKAIGLWYSPYIRLYTLGSSGRMAELSTYPRVEKDTSPHIYTKDIVFTVSKDDYNFNGRYPNAKYHPASNKFVDHGVEHTVYGFMDANRKFFSIMKVPIEDLLPAEGHLDSRKVLHKEGEQATHYQGNLLPGVFPVWVEKGDLKFTPEREDLYTFPCDGFPFPISYISKVEISEDDKWVEIPPNTLKSIRDQVKRLKKTEGGTLSGKFSIPKLVTEAPKVTIRVFYERRLWSK